MWDDFQATDLTTKVTDVDLPVYICQGRYDYTCSYDLARGYFEKLRAPMTGLAGLLFTSSTGPNAT